MKRPLLNQADREIANSDTFLGAVLKLRLAGLRFKRDVGCIRYNLYWRWITMATIKYKTNK